MAFLNLDPAFTSLEYPEIRDDTNLIEGLRQGRSHLITVDPASFSRHSIYCRKIDLQTMFFLVSPIQIQNVNSVKDMDSKYGTIFKFTIFLSFLKTENSYCLVPPTLICLQIETTVLKEL